jgi:hypothetical protein
MRVQASLKYVSDDIEKASDAATVVKEIKTLMTNYRLKGMMS